MKDISKCEHKFINDLALAKTQKVVIADKIGCDVRSVYNSLHRTFPADGPSEIRTRTRKHGFYKAKQQELDTILDYVLQHPWATNQEIIKECKLKTEHAWTVSRWLKKLGIGSYIACRRQGITPINVNKR